MGRTIVIGDVHGCRDELLDLLARLAPGVSDRLLFVGDLVAKGPDSRGVLDLVREIGARSILGNHEERLLKARAARQRGMPVPPLGVAQHQLYDALRDLDWLLLQELPLHLDEPEHGMRLVHAGVVPGVPIEKQARGDLLRMRSLDAEGRASERWQSTPWAAHYREQPHVVFGHDARSGLQLHPCATGLDSGCVYGGALSALVLPSGAPIPPERERRGWIVSVQARRSYAPRV